MFKKWLGKILKFFMPKRKITRGRCIIKIEDHIEKWFMLWSVNNGTPLSRGMYRSDFESWYRYNFPKISVFDLDRLIDEADSKGTDHPDFESCEDVIYYNSAGFNGRTLSKEELIEIYCDKYYDESPTRRVDWHKRS